MTKQELQNIYELLCSNELVNRQLAFQLAKAFRLNEDELLKLLWINYSKVGDKYVILEFSDKYIRHLKCTMAWSCRSDGIGMDGGKDSAFSTLLNYLICDYGR